MDRGAWRATVRGIARVEHDLIATNQPIWVPEEERENYEGTILKWKWLKMSKNQWNTLIHCFKNLKKSQDKQAFKKIYT